MEQFFQKYTAAFDAFDALAIANLYTLPCATVDADGSRVFTERDSLIEKFRINCTSMQAMDYQSSIFSILDVTEMGDAAKVANIAWRIFTKNSEIEFRALYVCHFIDNDWRIFSANVY